MARCRGMQAERCGVTVPKLQPHPCDMIHKKPPRVRFWMTRAYFVGAFSGMAIGAFRGGGAAVMNLGFGGAFTGAIAAGLVAGLLGRRAGTNNLR
jgi:hypothetical protein